MQTFSFWNSTIFSILTIQTSLCGVLVKAQVYGRILSCLLAERSGVETSSGKKDRYSQKCMRKQLNRTRLGSPVVNRPTMFNVHPLMTKPGQGFDQVALPLNKKKLKKLKN